MSDLPWREQIADLCRRMPTLPSYEAAHLYRDVVRLEQPHIEATLADPFTLGKYRTYVKRFTRRPPGRYFTDHHYAQKLAPTLDVIRRAASVVDAACGNGFEAVLFALHGVPVYANDISSARVEIARARCALYSDLLGEAFRVRVSCGDAIELAKTIEPVQVVFVQEAISHIHPAEVFLRAAARDLLQPGGRLIVCDSNSWNPVIRVRISRQLWTERRTLRSYVIEQVDPQTGRKYLMAEERLFSPVGIARALRAAGLLVEDLWMSGFATPRMTKTASPAAARRFDDMLARIPVVRNFGGIYTAVGRKPSS